MMRRIAISSLFLLAMLAGVALLAADRGTPGEAKAMLQKAVEYYKKVGRKQALADFNKKKAPFGDRDLYVACFGPDHRITANGGFPKLVGQSADLIRDADGKSVGEEGWDLASKNGEATLRYSWMNPVTRKMEPKVTFFAKVGEDVCGVGAYSPD
jgi:cytochrome c